MMIGDHCASFVIGWPDAKLSPNNASGKHWYARQPAKERARENCYDLAHGLGTLLQGDIQVEIIFCPPDKKRRDMDNLLASLKPHLDGLCRGMGIDDSQIRKIVMTWGGVQDGGKVNLTFTKMR